MSASAREVCWERMFPKEFGEAVAERPVCYMPLGTLERHGSHLPFGQDAMKAHGLCLRAAQKHGGVVLPALHWGTHGWWAEAYRQGLEGDGPTRKQPPGSVYVNEGLLINLLLSMFREVEYAGFEVIVALTGHYPEVQVQAVKNAARQYMGESQVKIWALCEPELSGSGSLRWTRRRWRRAETAKFAGHAIRCPSFPRCMRRGGTFSVGPAVRESNVAGGSGELVVSVGPCREQPRGMLLSERGSLTVPPGPALRRRSCRGAPSRYPGAMECATLPSCQIPLNSSAPSINSLSVIVTIRSPMPHGEGLVKASQWTPLPAPFPHPEPEAGLVGALVRPFSASCRLQSARVFSR